VRERAAVVLKGGAFVGVEVLAELEAEFLGEGLEGGQIFVVVELQSVGVVADDLGFVLGAGNDGAAHEFGASHGVDFEASVLDVDVHAVGHDAVGAPVDVLVLLVGVVGHAEDGERGDASGGDAVGGMAEEVA